MGQKPFVLDARRIALLPVTTDWFPSFTEPGCGIVHIAEKSFQNKVTSIARAALSRASNIERLGPKSPGTQNSWTPPRRG
jgi:hypothetical protein